MQIGTFTANQQWNRNIVDGKEAASYISNYGISEELIVPQVAQEIHLTQQPAPVSRQAQSSPQKPLMNQKNKRSRNATQNFHKLTNFENISSAINPENTFDEASVEMHNSSIDESQNSEIAKKIFEQVEFFLKYGMNDFLKYRLQQQNNHDPNQEIYFVRLKNLLPPELENFVTPTWYNDLEGEAKQVAKKFTCIQDEQTCINRIFNLLK